VAREPFTDEDNKLVARCRDGDDLAFEELVRKYQKTVINLVYHNIGHQSEVEDIAQKVFIKIYFSLPQFDNRRPFFPWLYRIAINQCYDELRRLRRSRIATFTELSLEETDSIEKLMNQNELQQPPIEERQDLYTLLYKLLNELPDQQKEAIVLRDIELIPYVEIAAIWGCTEQAARLKVFRARTRLKEQLERVLHRRKHSRKE
jgi:RNA polymerase sigma-70 factor, ECF subfamily